MKNLANCKPTEFLKQTNKIRKAVSNWLTVTDIMDIRNRQPVLSIVPESATDEEREKIEAENEKKKAAQATENLNTMLESCLDKHPDETLEVLGLMCFVEPGHIDDYPVSSYLRSFTEIIGNKDVMSFLLSLMQLGRTLGFVD